MASAAVSFDSSAGASPSAGASAAGASGAGAATGSGIFTFEAASRAAAIEDARRSPKRAIASV